VVIKCLAGSVKNETLEIGVEDPGEYPCGDRHEKEDFPRFQKPSPGFPFIWCLLLS
jgi:hypothetical protein